MAIIKQYHKDTDTTYVYESTSYWDAEKGQSRSKRRVIGKLDPVTGEIIPTGKRGRSKKAHPQEQNSVVSDIPTAAAELSEIQKKNVELELYVSSLKARIGELEEEVRRYRQAGEKISALAEKISAAALSLKK